MTFASKPSWLALTLINPSPTNGTRVRWIHGHDAAGRVPAKYTHVINLDGYLGKRSYPYVGDIIQIEKEAIGESALIVHKDITTREAIPLLKTTSAKLVDQFGILAITKEKKRDTLNETRKCREKTH